MFMFVFVLVNWVELFGLLDELCELIFEELYYVDLLLLDCEVVVE